MMRIDPVESRSDREAFLSFPYELYKEHPYWIPPLRMDQAKALNPSKNPFFEHGKIKQFLARKNGKVIGRIAGIISGMHLHKYQDDTGYFGFFETIEDPEVATALLDTAENWLKEQGLTAVRGPVNPTINDTSGLLVDGFERPPSILMPYNPPSYVRYLEDNGYQRAMTMWAYFVHAAYIEKEKLRRGADIVMRRNPGLSIRTLRIDDFWTDARHVLDIYNAAWSGNWGSVPMTENEFRELAKGLKQIIDPELVFFVEKDGKPVAFSVSIPNLNLALKHIPGGRLLPTGLPKLLAYDKLGALNELRMPLMGVLPEFHKQGFHAPLVNQTIQDGLKKGYYACEMSWVLDVNAPLINALDKMGAVKDKEYAMFEKRI